MKNREYWLKDLLEIEGLAKCWVQLSELLETKKIQMQYCGLYLFSDLYDRSIVGWEVYEEESADLASSLIKRICLKQGRLTTEPLILHSDNGSPMKGATMLATLYQLGIPPSNSRQRVSNDNPCGKSF